MLNSISGRVFVFTACAFWAGLGASADDKGDTKTKKLYPTAIPLPYNSCLIIRKKTDTLYVISGLADPVLHSSRAKLIIWRLDSEKELIEALEAQQTSGPRTPASVDKTKSTSIDLDAVKRATVEFHCFDKNFGWSAGNSKMGWLYLDSLEGVEVTLVDDLLLGIPSGGLKFEEPLVFVEREGDRIYKESFRHIGK